MRNQPVFPSRRDGTIRTTSVVGVHSEEVGRDEPSVGPGPIDFASEPEKHAVHDDGSEEEHLIFENFVVYV